MNMAAQQQPVFEYEVAPGWLKIRPFIMLTAMGFILYCMYLCGLNATKAGIEIIERVFWIGLAIYLFIGAGGVIGFIRMCDSGLARTVK